VDGATNGTALWPRSHHGAGWAPPAAGEVAAVEAAGKVGEATAEATAEAAAEATAEAAAETDAAEAASAAAAGAATHRGQAISPALRAGDAGLTTLLIDALRPYQPRPDLLRLDLLRLYLLRPYLLRLYLLRLDLLRLDLLRTYYGSTNYPGDALLFDFRLLHKALANGSTAIRPQHDT
jgi:hypothetical protein